MKPVRSNSFLGSCTLALVLTLGGVAASTDPILAELERMRLASRSSIVSLDQRSAHLLSFADRRFVAEISVEDADLTKAAISPDGKLLAYRTRSCGSVRVANFGGSMRVDLPEVTDADNFCWSQDGHKLLFQGKVAGTKSKRKLFLLQLDPQTLTELAEGYVYQPCWSHDGKQFVFESQDSIYLYDANARQAKHLGPGEYPTWSPNGKWIAFRSDRRYYLLDTDTGVRKLFFKDKRASTPLWWSPDSRYVAFVTHVRSFEGWFGYPDEVRLRIRRVNDGAEAWVLRFSGLGGWVHGFYWVVGLDTSGWHRID